MSQLKDIYTEQFIIDFSLKVKDAYTKFDHEVFVKSVLNDDWDELVLRARMHKIALELGNHLPDDYLEALDVLDEIVDDCVGFPYLFFPDFVSNFGLNDKHFDRSLLALKRYTPSSSSEFAIRQFILKDPNRVMKHMLEWSLDDNEHVRRLSSEGCRPRLPWGVSLPIYKEDPTPVLKILDNLKDDSSLYVRKSVANNLNDISKDNPDIVIEIAKSWINESKERDRIVRHGSRTLIKQFHPDIMELFGYSNPNNIIKDASIKIDADTRSIGDQSSLEYSIHLENDEPVKLRVEYAIDFIKANGKPSRKKFLLSDKTVGENELLKAKRNHSWEDLTTRKHYPGEYTIVLLVNGREVAHTSLNLI